MKVGICAIIKDCSFVYLNEWLEWHRLIGVDCFFIYDNESAIPIQNGIKDMYGVKVIPINGTGKQLEAYNDCIEKQKLKKDCDWIAFIDDDEFIVVENGNIKKLLEKQVNSGLCLNWVLFGSSEKGTENKTQIQKYTKHLPLSCKVNLHVKSIVKIDKVKVINQPHFALYNEGVAVNVKGEVVNTPFASEAVQEIAWINHYYCRSREEYAARIERGGVLNSLKYSMDYFESLNQKATEHTTKIQEIYKSLTK